MPGNTQERNPSEAYSGALETKKQADFEFSRLHSYSVPLTRFSMKAKGEKGNDDKLYNQDDVKRSVSNLEQLLVPEDSF